VRFHGQGRELYRYNYPMEELVRWASMLRPHLKSKALYAFFNNDYEAHAPNNALQFRDLIGEASRVHHPKSGGDRDGAR
jgi:uncharacterized protein YecE (DUF72 family)